MCIGLWWANAMLQSLFGLFKLCATHDKLMKVRHAFWQASDNVTNTPLQGNYGLSSSAFQRQNMPKPSMLLVPIPSERVALAPSALPHGLCLACTSPYSDLFPCPCPSLCLLDLCRKDHRHLVQAFPSWARTAHGEDGSAVAATQMP